MVKGLNVEDSMKTLAIVGLVLSVIGSAVLWFRGCTHPQDCRVLERIPPDKRNPTVQGIQWRCTRCLAIVGSWSHTPSWSLRARLRRQVVAKDQDRKRA